MERNDERANPNAWGQSPSGDHSCDFDERPGGLRVYERSGGCCPPSRKIPGSGYDLEKRVCDCRRAARALYERNVSTTVLQIGNAGIDYQNKVWGICAGSGRARRPATAPSHRDGHPLAEDVTDAIANKHDAHDPCHRVVRRTGSCRAIGWGQSASARVGAATQHNGELVGLRTATGPRRYSLRARARCSSSEAGGGGPCRETVRLREVRMILLRPIASKSSDAAFCHYYSTMMVTRSIVTDAARGRWQKQKNYEGIGLRTSFRGAFVYCGMCFGHSLLICSRASAS